MKEGMKGNSLQEIASSNHPEVSAILAEMVWITQLFESTKFQVTRQEETQSAILKK